jgi:hypothetical protein
LAAASLAATFTGTGTLTGWKVVRDGEEVCSNPAVDTSSKEIRCEWGAVADTAAARGQLSVLWDLMPASGRNRSRMPCRSLQLDHDRQKQKAGSYSLSYENRSRGRRDCPHPWSEWPSTKNPAYDRTVAIVAPRTCKLTPLACGRRARRERSRPFLEAG